MPNPLYNVPGLGGYVGQEEANRAQQTGTLQNALQFQTLQQHLTDFARQQQFRQAIANLPPEQRTMGNYMGLATQYGSPTDIMHYGGQREAAAARLQQAHQIFMLNYETRRQQLKSLADKRAFDKSAAVYHMALQREAAQYNLGSMIPPFQPPSDEGEAGPLSPAQRHSGQWTEPPPGMVPPEDVEALHRAQLQATAGAPSVAEPGAAPPQAIPEPLPAAGAPLGPMSDPEREMYLLQQRAQVPQGGALEGPGAPGGPQVSGAPEPTPLDMRSIADLSGLGGGMPQEIAALPPREQAKWTQERQRMLATLPDHSAARKMAFERLYFGKEPAGWGQVGQPTKTLVRNIWAQLADQLGLSDSEAAMLPYDNKIKMKALGNLVNWGATAARSADKLGRDLQVALSYATRLPLAQIQLINRGVVAGMKEFNSPDANAYASAINSVRLEYARLMSGPTSNAMLPVEAMKTSNELVSRGVNPAALAEVGRQMQKDANNTIKATNDQIGSLRESITSVGRTPLFKETPEGPVGRRAEGQRGTSKSGKPIIIRNGKWEYE